LNLSKVIIVDDEPIMCDELKCLLENSGEVEIVGIGHNGEDAIALVDKLDVDVVFLDIQMPVMNGMEAARILSSRAHSPLIVFITAFNNFAVDAFQVDAVDYILKPFDERDIERVLKKLRSRRMKTPTELPRSFIKKVLAETGDRLEVIDVKQVQYFQAENRQIFICTLAGKRYEIRTRLNELEAALNPEDFFRCHRNFIVNVNQIGQLANWFNRGYLLIMTPSQAEIPVGRVYAARLKMYLPL
jgi:two-component system LytT family response regulator/two-component system response regulator LytT